MSVCQRWCLIWYLATCSVSWRVAGSDTGWECLCCVTLEMVRARSWVTNNCYYHFCYSLLLQLLLVTAYIVTSLWSSIHNYALLLLKMYIHTYIHICILYLAAQGCGLSVPGEFGWGGVASTFFYVDPIRKTSVIFLTQLIPSSANIHVRAQIRWITHWLLDHKSHGST